jgi:hypothetical protein
MKLRKYKRWRSIKDYFLIWKRGERMAEERDIMFCRVESMKAFFLALFVAACIFPSCTFLDRGPKAHSGGAAHTLSGVLIFVQGIDAHGDFGAVPALLYGSDENAQRIAAGVLQSLVDGQAGTGVDVNSLLMQLAQSPYAFILKQGSGDSLEWLVAFKALSQENVDAFIRTFREGFWQRFAPVAVRMRELQDGRIVRDVVEDPLPILAETGAYRGYTVSELTNRLSGEQWVDARYRDAFLVSNSAALLRDTIDRGFLPSLRSIRFTNEGIALLSSTLPDSDMLRSLLTLLPPGGVLSERDVFCSSPVYSE